MAYSDQVRAAAVKRALGRAARNADFYHDLRQGELVVDRAWTAKELTSPRLRYHSKGRTGRSHYRTSQLTVRVRQMTAEESDRLLKFKAPTPWRKEKLVGRGY
jgi:ribosomal protein L22